MKMRDLNEYENDIVEQIISGRDFSEIGNDFGLTTKSLKSELTLIIDKLGFENIEYEFLKILFQKQY